MACELLQREFTTSTGESRLVAVRQLPASKSLDLHVELVGKLGSSIYAFVENKYNFADILHLMRQNNHETVAELIKRVVCLAVVEGKEVKPATYDFVFGGEMMLACQVFGFVLEANYLDFFKQGLEINARRSLEAAEASKMEESKTSETPTT